MEKTYKKLSDTAVEVTTPVVSIMTIDVLLAEREQCLKKIDLANERIAEIDAQVIEFKNLQVLTNDEYVAKIELEKPILVEGPIEEKPII